MPFAKNYDVSAMSAELHRILDTPEVSEAIRRCARERTPRARHDARTALAAAGVAPKDRERVLRDALKTQRWANADRTAKRQGR
jgi:hypothetical protein